MQRNVFTTLISILGLTLFTHANAQSCGEPTPSVLDGIVRIVGDNVEGSGVVVRKDRVITAAHVVDGIENLAVSFNGIERPAAVISVYVEKDIAVLAVDTQNQIPVRFSREELNLYENVWTIGYPLGNEQLSSPGTFEGLVDGDLHTTASVDHGQSGGGLIVCKNGQHVLAGMITAFGAIATGDSYIRLDDYSISVALNEIEWMINASAQHALYDAPGNEF